MVGTAQRLELHRGRLSRSVARASPSRPLRRRPKSSRPLPRKKLPGKRALPPYKNTDGYIGSGPYPLSNSRQNSWSHPANPDPMHRRSGPRNDGLDTVRNEFTRDSGRNFHPLMTPSTGLSRDHSAIPDSRPRTHPPPAIPHLHRVHQTAPHVQIARRDLAIGSHHPPRNAFSISSSVSPNGT